MSSWKAYLEDQPWRMRRCLHVVRKEPGTIAVVQALVMRSVPEGSLIAQDDGILADHSDESEDFLRAIMDVAWNVGIRPTGFEDHTNELKATRYHLEDMRLLSKVRKP